MALSQHPTVFVSHIREEAPLALALKSQLEDMFVGAVNIFVASDSESLPAGSLWLEGIRDAIMRSSIALVLVSSRSKDRPWINFEAGAVAFSKTMIPICHSGLHPSQLPATLQGWQAVDLQEADGLRRLFQRIARLLELREPSLEWDKLAELFTKISLEIGPPENDPSGATAAWAFPSSENLQTQIAIQESITKTREHISLYGIGLNPFWNTEARHSLEAAARRGVRVRICIADFQSKEIVTRVRVEEPASEFTVRKAEDLVSMLVESEQQIADPRRYEVRLFRHRPTYSMLIFDLELYVFPYPYKLLGTDAPTYYSRGRDRAVEFFLNQFERIYEDATPAKSVGT
jgi:hypothetical protein